MSETFTILKSVELDYGVAELRSDNILTFEPNHLLKDYTVPILKELLSAFIEITEGKPRLYYCNNSYILSMLSKEEQDFVNKHFLEFATAFAMLEGSPITRLITNSFISAYKPIIPVKMFKRKEDAITWLKEKG